MKGEKWKFLEKKDKRAPNNDGSSPTPNPPYRLPIWNIIFMLILLWIWQDAVTNLTVKTLNYSEFKQHVRNGEVTEAKISPDRIQGKIKLKPGSTNTVAATTNAPAGKKTKADPDGDPN